VSGWGWGFKGHFLSCCILSRDWGNPQHVCVASMFHALWFYERRDFTE
jgi:hypothetical protein